MNRYSITARRNRKKKQNNAINLLDLYRLPDGMWVYDDPDLGVYVEAFILGSSEVIDSVVGEKTKTCTIAVSSEPIPFADAVLVNVDDEVEGNIRGWYQKDDSDLPPNWLCGRTLDYFPDYPKRIYAKVITKG